MKKLGVIILIALVGICSCKMGYASWHHLLRPASKVITNVKEDKQPASYTKKYEAEVFSQTELPDSGEFKCYYVKIRLPKDTINYLPFIKVFLPGMIDIENIPYAKVKADFFLHNDTINKYNSVIWIYKNNPPAEAHNSTIINYLGFGIVWLLLFLCLIVLIFSNFHKTK